MHEPKGLTHLKFTNDVLSLVFTLDNVIKLWFFLCTGISYGSRTADNGRPPAGDEWCVDWGGPRVSPPSGHDYLRSVSLWQGKYNQYLSNRVRALVVWLISTCKQTEYLLVYTLYIPIKPYVDPPISNKLYLHVSAQLSKPLS